MSHTKQKYDEHLHTLAPHMFQDPLPEKGNHTQKRNKEEAIRRTEQRRTKQTTHTSKRDIQEKQSKASKAKKAKQGKVRTSNKQSDT